VVVVVGVSVVAVLAQVSFISALPGWLPRFNLLVVLTVYVTVSEGLQRSLPWVVTAGMLYDLYAPNGFGVHAWSLLASAVAIYLCATKIVTNRTLAALLALGALGDMVSVTTQVAFTWLYQVFHLTVWEWYNVWNLRWAASQMAGLAADLVVLAALFTIRRRAITDVIAEPR